MKWSFGVSVEVQVLPGYRVSTSLITTTTLSDYLSATVSAAMQLGPPDTPHVPACVDTTYPSASWASSHDPGGGGQRTNGTDMVPYNILSVRQQILIRSLAILRTRYSFYLPT